MPDVCNRCRSVRRKWKQWFFLDGKTWCPSCAPPDMRAARSARKREIASARPRQPGKREESDRAARAVLEDGVTRKDAMARFSIGRTTLLAAIDRVRAARIGGG